MIRRIKKLYAGMAKRHITVCSNGWDTFRCIIHMSSSFDIALWRDKRYLNDKNPIHDRGTESIFRFSAESFEYDFKFKKK